ncbi:Gfo/Idh/MocA family protein [Aestuariibaculum suncheonense]|uniref:Gfo/Idh/MocA family oxidoreductase n=1 Tax=Aestuariibaculum suncheonense TaxID=1028745 RepID=A0A8J6QR38_9FLAO|nr:Gfo/Idh/MocA family oxidoreductase [Aestuariibaculum suncheonense]MBD0834774.1 Gfo/Idh/MocA family oxidoreductase [Aestuariibaculum suncheonense]
MKRRNFIKDGTIASASILVAPYVFSDVLKRSSLNKINVGVIGTGNRGAGLINMMNGIENLNVMAGCDILPFHLKNGLSKIQSKKEAYQDYRKLLENKDIDAVIVSTPIYNHSQIAADAMDAGKHVYCEKTLAKGYPAIGKLLKQEKSFNGIFQTGHQYHSSRLYTHIVDLIQQGKVGEIVAFECQWNRHGNWRRPVPDPSFEKAINWRMYKEYSGGLVAELCSHQIDFVNWVLKSTPEQVIGVGGIDYWKDGRETYDNIHVIYSYSNGVKAKFTCLTNNAKDGYQIKVIGDKGTIIIDMHKAWFYPEGSYKNELTEVDGVSGATVQWDGQKGIPIQVNHLNPTKQALIDFSESINNSIMPRSNLISGAKTAVCVQMALDAMYNNQTVSWNTNLFSN